MAKLSITLKIAGTSFPFDIESSEEETWRHAEREVNRLFAENAHPSLIPKDQLALAALSLAMENVTLRSSRSLGEDHDRLAEIEREMNDYLAEVGRK
jgi:cell division protein ZapA